jgi:hypothetical protein
MEKRRIKRIDVHIGAKVILENKNYDSFLDNVSNEGLCLMINSKEKEPEFIPEKTFDLEFYTKQKNQIKINCIIKWFTESRRSGPYIEYLIGSEVIAPPVEYKEFLASL